jgi:integrase/recombinase XerC/integrase/recombinase XerD
MALAQREYILSDKKYKKAKKSVYLFPDTKGDFIREFAFNKRWRTFREKNDLDYNTYFPYVFRHTMCTNLIKSGTSVATVQRIIGDNTVDVIMKVYTHINSTDIADAMGGVHHNYANLQIE